MSKPLVSICCVTYNHAPFIRQCLDGFLMQKGVNYEILIHDDCSTDGTTEIVKEYATKYPDLIFPLYETENQYSKGVWVDGLNYRRARGKYIAYCEGDDYWTDPLKLQKQVDFMEANPEYSVCFHRVSNFNVRLSTYKEDKYSNLHAGNIDINVSMYFKENCLIAPLSMLFRYSYFSFDWPKQYHGYRDTHEIYHLLRVGKGKFLNFIGGVYTQHPGGVSSGIDVLQHCKEECLHVTELYISNKDDCDLKKYLQSVLHWVLNEYLRIGMYSLYWKTMQSILINTPELWPYVMWHQLKRMIKNIFT